MAVLTMCGKQLVTCCHASRRAETERIPCLPLRSQSPRDAKGGFQCVSKISGASRHPLGLRLRRAYDTRAEERVSVIP
jgi:hypothetical protein